MTLEERRQEEENMRDFLTQEESFLQSQYDQYLIIYMKLNNNNNNK